MSTQAKRTQPASISDYLAALPDDRRVLVEAVRQMVIENLDDGFEEGIQYGMIGWYIPHRFYPDGYHCDPKQPVPFLALASQKNYVSLYLMGIYADASERERFERDWAAAGLKLDMGKSCLRFKRLDDISLPILAETLRRMPSSRFLELYEAAIPPKRRRSTSGARAGADRSKGADVSSSTGPKRAAKQGTKPGTGRAQPKP